TALGTTVIATTSICVKCLATLTSTNLPRVSWLESETIVLRSKRRPRDRLKNRLANWRKRKRRPQKKQTADGIVGHRLLAVSGSHRSASTRTVKPLLHCFFSGRKALRRGQ
ncbi:hypothetical protein Bpfe_001372, partial [Biomphalaria pfeifferi]